MKVLIVGAGAVGYHLAARLSDAAQSVTVIDSRADRVRHVADNLDVMAIHGSGAHVPTLEQAGIRDADLVAAVSGVDEVNLLACFIASRNGVQTTIARVRTPSDYGPDRPVSKSALGVSHFISPEQECAREIFELLVTPTATDLESFAEGRVRLVGMRIRAGSPAMGRSISAVARELKGHQFVIAALVRGGKTRIPTGDTHLLANDKIFVLAPPREAPLLPLVSGESPRRVRRVMIAGGSDEAVHLIHHLQDANVHCTLLERDEGRARELAELLPRALVLRADATDLELLELEGVEGVDGFVSLTDRDEVNMLVALLAKSLNARRVIPLLHKPEYMKLVERVGLDAAVSPRISAGNAVLRLIRSDAVSKVATVGDSRAEVMEVLIETGSQLVDQRIRDVSFPKGTLLGVLVRDDEVVLPRGEDRICSGDLAIFVALPESIPALERLVR